MGGAPVRIEPRLVGIGIEAEVGYVADSDPAEAGRDVAAKVEQRLSVILRGAEETLICLIGAVEIRDEFGPDLIARLADAGAEHGNDRIPSRAELLHRKDGFVEHSAERPLPSGMGRAD